MEGEGGEGYRGQKKRQRGGASEAEGGLWGLEMDGNILFFPPSSLLLFLTLSGSRLQQSCVEAGKAAGSTKVGLSSKDAPRCSDQSGCTPPTRGDAAQRGGGWSRCDVCPAV